MGVFISADEQLMLMEHHAAATGITDYDKIREVMADGLIAVHGRNARFNYEPISKEKLEEFLDWLNESED